jgi:hypothetical protein
MRCKNCGWDNPAGNVKCEKCNASLQGSMIDSSDLGDISGTRNSSSGFDPKKTAMGCPGCGYPIKPTDKICPSCNENLGKSGVGGDTSTHGKDNNSSGKENNPIIERSGGTVIGGYPGGSNGSGINPEYSDEGNRRKLVGFLVTYTLDPNGIFFPLYEGRNYVGQSKDCNICIQGDNKISGKHFSILYRSVDMKFKFKDEQSTNGTWVNGVLCDEGTLSNHNLIQIGTTKLILLIIPQPK